MLGQMLSSTTDGWTLLKVFAVLVPILLVLWIILTVTALHRRDVYFWSLGSTWVSVIVCPISLVVASSSTLSRLHDESAPLFELPLLAGAALYAFAFLYAVIRNYAATKSAILALSTAILQQLAVLGAIFLFLRWRGEEINRGR